MRISRVKQAGAAHRVAAVVACGLLFVSACGGGDGKGGSPASPSVPAQTQAPVADPVVTIQFRYTCHPCVADWDNYYIWVQTGPGPGEGKAVYRQPGMTAETETLTWTGTLKPGAHLVEVWIANAETQYSIVSVAAGAAANTGGIRPNSFRSASNMGDIGTAKDVRSFGRCGITTTWPSRPPGTYNAYFYVDVMLGTAADVC